jgi:hypothetical protein
MLYLAFLLVVKVVVTRGLSFAGSYWDVNAGITALQTRRCDNISKVWCENIVHFLLWLAFGIARVTI